jgi:hypothetical protein
MNDIIERLEKASGPDRELDAQIAAQLCDGSVNVEGRYWKPGVRGFCIAPRYTASIDAAMTLAEGFGGEVTFFKDGTAKAFVWQPYPMAVEGKGPTPALALCIAALKAHKEGAIS